MYNYEYGWKFLSEILSSELVLTVNIITITI